MCVKIINEFACEMNFPHSEINTMKGVAGGVREVKIMKTPLSQLKQAIYVPALCAALPHCCPLASFVAAAKLPFTRIIKRLVMPQPRPRPRPRPRSPPIQLVNQATKRLLKSFAYFLFFFIYFFSFLFLCVFVLLKFNLWRSDLPTYYLSSLA